MEAMVRAEMHADKKAKFTEIEKAGAATPGVTDIDDDEEEEEE